MLCVTNGEDFTLLLPNFHLHRLMIATKINSLSTRHLSL
ncbi:MAG: hypothetical protein OFPI_43620 [Osedax symbiont Rs2]|nr:MAG: hypothetical protein OFPI_43620 [Osedax symbiont Rs2]